MTAVVCVPGPVRAAEALVAVSANFAAVMKQLRPIFESRGEHALKLSIGSTGTLYAQIRNGAPFDVLLAADQARPAKLEAAGMTVRGSRFTYALGRLSGWSRDPDLIRGRGPAALTDPEVDRIAIANPDLAPYGVAARQTLRHHGLWSAVADKIVMGQNVGQAFSMVATGNAAVGIVARSYVLSPRNDRAGSRWDVPAAAHDPIRQDAVRLTAGADNAAAAAFLAFLRTPEAKAIIRDFGYGIDE